jgi:PRTRC genetic system protein E
MFKTFHDMLKNDERIQFTVTRKGDQLAVLVQPVLQGASDDKASETIQSLRGALSMPLYVVTHPESLDRDFPQSLADFAGFREQGHSYLNEVMSRIKEAGKQAKAVADADKAETGNSKAKAEPVADSSNIIPAVNGKLETLVPATVSLSEKSLF